jgi:hypothetical protein
VAWASRKGRNWARVVGALLFAGGGAQLVALYYTTHFWRQLLLPQVWLIAACLAGFSAAGLMWLRRSDAVFRPTPGTADGVAAAPADDPSAGVGVTTWLAGAAAVVAVMVLYALLR